MIYSDDTLGFQILTVEKFTHKEGVFQVAGRPYAAFSFRVSGEGKFEVGEKTFTNRAGDILFIPAETSYRVNYSVSESIVVHFLDCTYRESESHTLANPSAFSLLFAQLLEGWEEKHSVNRAKSHIYRILAKMAEANDLSNENTPFARCVRRMEEDFSNPELDIAALCHAEYVSPSGLQRAFSDRFGISPKQYLIKLRLSHALSLLSEGTLSVREVALSCGFRDEKYFSRAFSRRYGYPPSHAKYKMFI